MAGGLKALRGGSLTAGSVASIQALEGELPGAVRRWVRAGVLLGTGGYAVGTLVSWIMAPGLALPRLPELAVMAFGLAALILIRRGRVRLGGVLFLSAAFTEIHLSFFLHGVATPSLVVAPVLVVGFGMFLGAGVALGTGALSVAAAFLAAVVDVVEPGLSAAELERVVFFGMATAGASVLTALGVRSFGELAASLARARRRSEDLIRFAPDGVLVLSGDGRVREANPKAAAILGLGREAVLGASLVDLGLSPVVEGLGDRPWSGAVGTTQPVTVPLEGREGRRWVEVTARTAVGDPEARLQLMLRDVTARVRSEERERLLAEQVQRSRRMAAVGTLAGGLAHDFNNLLTVIRGSADLIRLEGGDELAPMAGDILDAESRGAALIRQLLAFAQRGPGRVEALDPAVELRRMEPVMRGLLGDRLRLVLQPASTRLVEADRGQLEEALVHLLDNAREASMGGGAEVRVEAHDERGPAGAALVRITVADQGEGMEPETVDRMFDPFFTTREVGRAGLGLASVHAIVQEHGGSIRVDSAPGRGTSVHLLLPARPSVEGGTAEGRAG